MNIVTILVLVQFTFALIMAGLAIRASQRDAIPARNPFILMMTGLTIWAVSYGLLVALPSANATITMSNVQYIGIVIAPASWLLFCYEYTRQQHAPRWLWALLTLHPILTTVIVWWDPSNLFHTSQGTRMLNGYTFVDSTLGPLFWVHAAYSYLAILAGMVLLVRAYLRAQKLYRQQISLLLLGSLVPWAGNAYTIFFDPGFDITSMLFGVTGLAMAWSFFRYGMLDIMPVARDRIFENMEDAVFVLDANANLVDINPAAERIFDIEAASVIGQRMIAAFPDYREDMLPFATAENTHAEVTVRGRVFDLRISLLGDNAGRLIVLRDITERKQAEAEREALIKELNAYAHTVAHDLKTPLGVIRGYASVIKMQGGLPERSERAVEAIHRNSGKLAAIVDDLLLLASVRGEAEIAREALDMAAIVKNALDRLYGMVEQHEVAITLPEVWPTAYGHPGWVEEVWANYLSNAIKYGGQPPKIEVGADELKEAGHIRFWVRDNGKGLTPAEQGRLFVEFSRVDEARAEGHGLGLSIVERIVTRLEGEVSVESTPGKGSTFGFTLPVSPAPTAE